MPRVDTRSCLASITETLSNKRGNIQQPAKGTRSGATKIMVSRSRLSLSLSPRCHPHLVSFRFPCFVLSVSRWNWKLIPCNEAAGSESMKIIRGERT